MKKKGIITIIVAVIIIFIDQISKIYIVNFQDNNLVLIKGLIELNRVTNTGIAFGLANKNLMSIIITDIIVIFVILKFIINQRKNINLVTQLSLTFILSGGISNLIDRIFKGGVVDFIDISQAIKYFPVFNIADICIVLGFIVFVVLSWINLMNLRKENIGGSKID